MGFFDKLFKKKEEKKEEAPAAKPKAEPASTSASFKAEPAPAKPAEAPKTEAPKAEGGNPDPYAFIVPPVASPGDADVPKDAILPAADLGPLLPGAPAGGKIKLAVYWTAACGGCDVSLLDTHERLLTIGDMAEIVMWPVAADGKEKDIAAMEDGAHQRSHQELRERAHGQAAEAEVQDRRRLRNLRHVRRKPRPGQPGPRRSRGDPGLRLHQDPLLSQLPGGLPQGRTRDPPDILPGPRGRAHHPDPVRHRQDARPGHRC